MTETIIKWKVGGIYKANAEKCYQEISGIGDEVKPEDVVERAKDAGTELHKCFLWDDTEAANRYRIYQARNIINNLIVVRQEKKEEPDDKKPIQFRVMMKNSTERGSGYKQTIAMVRDVDEYKLLLEQAYRELRVFKEKYSCLSELAEILALID